MNNQLQVIINNVKVHIQNNKNEEINELKKEWYDLWNEFSNYFKEFSLSVRVNQVWKEFIEIWGNDINTNVFYTFRGKLDKFLKDTINNLNTELLNSDLKSNLYDNCTYIQNNNQKTTELVSFGSKKITSDIDVTINGRCFFSSYIILKVIHALLLDLFSPQIPFHKIFTFFDMNFYLSDFAFPKQLNVPSFKDKKEQNLSDWIVTESPLQLKLAFLSKANHDNDRGYEDQVLQLTNILNKYYLDLKKTNKNIESTFQDYFINSISYLATFEDECYVTQGAFYHVVLMGQRGVKFTNIKSQEQIRQINFMMTCSLIENLKMAILHAKSESSFQKYIERARDAINRMSEDFKKRSLLPYLLKYLGDNQITQKIYSYWSGTNNNNEKEVLELSLINNNSNNSIENIEKYLKGLLDYTMQQQELNTENTVWSFISNKIRNINLSKVILDITKESLDSLKDPKIREELYQNIISGTGFYGGSKMKKLTTKDKQSVKKVVSGKERVVYVDSKRCQYVKLNGSFRAIKDLRNQTQSKKKSTKSKK